MTGRLLWIAWVTWLNIGFAIRILLQFNQNPAEHYWIAAKWVLQYLKGTMELEMRYSRNSSNVVAGVLTGYSDSNYAEDED